jgi:membrane-associated phospholipid phosphatase
MIRASPLVRVALYGFAFIVIYLAAVLTGVGQRLDAISLATLEVLRMDPLTDLFALRSWIPIALIVAVGVLVVVALARRRRAAAFRAVCVVGLTYVVSQVLKDDLLGRPDLGDFSYDYNTYPSGHVAVSLAAAVAICWLLPRASGRALAIGLGGVTMCVALFSVLSFAHRASDVVGGALLAGMVGALTNAVPSARGRGGERGVLWAPAMVAAGGAAVMSSAAALLPWTTADAVVTVLVEAAVLLGTAGAISAVLVSEVGVSPRAPGSLRP